eukprot:363866-Chlamydomonas_euryale.AAC.3
MLCTDGPREGTHVTVSQRHVLPETAPAGCQANGRLPTPWLTEREEVQRRSRARGHLAHGRPSAAANPLFLGRTRHDTWGGGTAPSSLSALRRRCPHSAVASCIGTGRLCFCTGAWLPACWRGTLLSRQDLRQGMQYTG